MGMVLAITSGKGGVGKSTVSVGIAAAFCLNHQRTLLVDTDEGLRCLDGMLGLTEQVYLDISDVSPNPERLTSAVIAVDSVPGLHLLAAPASFGTIQPESFGAVISAASSLYDVVIIDCPAGVEERYYAGLPKDSRILVVTNSDAAALRGAMQAGILVRRLGFADVHLILNKFSADHVGRLHADVNKIIDQTEISLIGIVPQDSEILRAAAAGKPSQRGRAMMAFGRIAARIEGETVLLPPVGRI